MKPGRLVITPDMLMPLSVIGGAMRGAGAMSLVMQILLIGAMVPQVGAVLQVWLACEEHLMAASLALPEPCLDGDGTEGDDDDNDGGEPSCDWLRMVGCLWLMRPETRSWLVLTLPRHFDGRSIVAATVSPEINRSPLLLLINVTKTKFFEPVLAPTQNCVLIVPVS